VRSLAEAAKAAAPALARSTGAVRAELLCTAARLLRSAGPEVLAANRADVEAGAAQGLSATALDRLSLDERRVEQMAGALEAVAALPDPLGAVDRGWALPNGVLVRRVAVPLGLIGVIYENRPNVTSDAAGLCLRSGNAVLLRGSASALRSNRAIAAVLRSAVQAVGLPPDVVGLVEDPSHDGAVEMLGLEGLIDCVVPRGGPALVRLVKEEARVPFVLDGDGNCHLYVDRAADLDMALEIAENAKVQRPSVCNAIETLLVHEEVAEVFLPRLAERLATVELRGDERVCALIPRAKPASEADWAEEFLDLVLALGVVSSLDEAIGHIARYGTGHSEAIVTEDLGAANRFVQEVDAAAVLVNASTRLVDGGELGLGAEIGISTQKLHVRGPMGLEALVCRKLVLSGTGQIRR
jgi:glutamate-5-semialdehyde dehydrogenase